MICGHPVQTSEFWPTVCVMPRNHHQRFHVDASHWCPWDSRWVRPDDTGGDAPARCEGGAVVHQRCLFAMDAERVGIRVAA